MGHKCGRLVDGDGPFCGECEHRIINAMQEDDLLETDLAHAAEDIAESRKRMLRETDTRRLESLTIQIELLQSILNKMRLDLDAKLIAHRSLPLVFGSVA